MVNMTLVKEKRVAEEMSQREVAEILGVHQVTYSGYERGKYAPPEEISEKLIELFGSDVIDIKESPAPHHDKLIDRLYPEEEARKVKWGVDCVLSEEPERYPEGKNDEGYPDPTAAKAVKEVKISTIQPTVGRIYEILSNKKDCNRAILIMSVSEEFVTGCMVYTRPWTCNYPEMVFSTGRFVVDISEIKRFSINSIETHRSCDLPQCWKDFNIIKSKLAARLGIQTVIERTVEVEKPVEKIVEKIVEVPAQPDPLKDAVYMVYNDMMTRLGGK